MAVTTINLSDPISTLVTKTNTISADLGDKAALTTNVTTNLVTAINSVRDQILDVDDNRNIIDVTNTYIENNQSVEGYCGPADYYLTSKISDLDNNGFIDLIGKSLYDSSNFLRWEWNGNKFIRVE